MKTRLALLAALVGAASLTVAAQAGQQHYSAWEPAQKIDEIERQQLGAEHAVPGRVPDPVTRRAQPLHGLEPSGREGPARHLGRPPAEPRTPRGAHPRTSASPSTRPRTTSVRRRSSSGGLFFVSREALPGSCGLGDIYFTRYSRKHGWSEPQHLGCAPDGPNSALDEQGPSYVEAGWTPSLYFSRSSATVPGDIFVSEGFAGLGLRPGHGRRRVERPGGERHPAERAEGRARGRLLLEPHGHARRPGHLGRDAARASTTRGRRPSIWARR